MHPNTTDRLDLGPLLLARARQAIAHHLGAGPAPADDARLRERGACFVTLHRHGELRGCIGSIRPQRPLGEDVVQNAVAAATKDPRFPPLAWDELASTQIEVSVLSSPEFIDFDDESDLMRQIVPREHGLILFAGCRSATFLPQVWDQLPEPEGFLAALKRKAGLPPDRPAGGLMAARFEVRSWQENPGGA
ncbi:AmmeMemoRadiSam system protein A [Azoarcus sp. L1K30]|uniref:AmmeMemoRadiSam system protein A n=1 Tax=Azoarcus sp. L1K30 TaxID=2820277 RepID=UPI001B8264EE|nr:AmmeMemoRadiSam system protein A [Azoarcus sp. L1K30]MBR0565261.1 AmmeMemoRadiSam system protein A [Azoarcus sp. L1K30]